MSYFAQGPAHFESGHGVWKLASDKFGQLIQLNFQELRREADPHTLHEYELQVYVSVTWFSTTLHYFLGDPDNGRKVDLVKTGSGNPS